MDAAAKHCAAGAGIWQWASSDENSEPDLVYACAGDVPTLEVLAATVILRQEFPDLKIRVVNLMKLQPEKEHPHGLSDADFDALFTRDKPVIFAFHGYPWLDSPPDLPPDESRAIPRSRLQGRRHDDHAVRYGRPQRSRPLSPRH
jgi:phosphoketolase